MTSAKHFCRSLPKNAREVVQVVITEFLQHPCIDLRIYVGDDESKKPTKKGLCLRIGQLPALRQAVQEAEAEAQRLGFLVKGGD